MNAENKKKKAWGAFHFLICATLFILVLYITEKQPTNSYANIGHDNRFGVQALIKDHSFPRDDSQNVPPIWASSSKMKNFEIATSIIETATEKYTLTCLERLRLYKITLAGKIYVDKKSCWGVARVSNRPPTVDIIIDESHLDEHIIHHEIFHLIDMMIGTSDFKNTWPSSPYQTRDQHSTVTRDQVDDDPVLEDAAETFSDMMMGRRIEGSKYLIVKSYVSQVCAVPMWLKIQQWGSNMADDPPDEYPQGKYIDPRKLGGAQTPSQYLPNDYLKTGAGIHSPDGTAPAAMGNEGDSIIKFGGVGGVGGLIAGAIATEGIGVALYGIAGIILGGIAGALKDKDGGEPNDGGGGAGGTLGSVKVDLEDKFIPDKDSSSPYEDPIRGYSYDPMQGGVSRGGITPGNSARGNQRGSRRSPGQHSSVPERDPGGVMGGHIYNDMYKDSGQGKDSGSSSQSQTGTVSGEAGGRQGMGSGWEVFVPPQETPTQGPGPKSKEEKEWDKKQQDRKNKGGTNQSGYSDDSTDNDDPVEDNDPEEEEPEEQPEAPPGEGGGDDGEGGGSSDDGEGYYGGRPSPKLTKASKTAAGPTHNRFGALLGSIGQGRVSSDDQTGWGGDHPNVSEGGEGNDGVRPGSIGKAKGPSPDKGDEDKKRDARALWGPYDGGGSEGGWTGVHPKVYGISVGAIGGSAATRRRRSR